MLSKSILRDVLRVGIGIYILGVVMVLFFFIFKITGYEVILGALLGCTYSTLSFLFLAISLETSLSKEKNAAKTSMGTGYTLRLLGAAAMIIWAIKAPYFNYLAAIIPLLFQRIVIMILSFSDTRKNKRSEKI